MSDEEHLTLLKQGIEIWNQWRREHPEISPDLSEVDLSIADLCEVDFRGTELRGANLSRAYLIGADLSEANLSWTSLSGADLSKANLRGANLSRADLRGTNLSEANLSRVDFSEASLSEANLSEANLSEAGFIGSNLRGANLNRADLSKADLFEANLNEADLTQADLSLAFLVRTQALKTNFYRATFTGACLEGWEYDRTTNLEETVCEYIYIKEKEKKRLPNDPTRNFASGEFSHLFQKDLGTIEFVFKHEIDWQVFLTSFKQLQTENTNLQLSLQAIENKPDGVLLVRLEARSHVGTAKIKEAFWQKYEFLLEAKDRQIFAPQSIELQRQANIKLLKIVERMAEKDSFEANVYNFLPDERVI